MDFFQPLDRGTSYLFDFLGATTEHWFPLFWLGYLASSWWMAGLVILAAGFWLAGIRKYRSAFIVLACFILCLVLVEGVRFLVDRPPPDKALKWVNEPGTIWVGTLQNQGNFPSQGIFLSTLAWIHLWMTARISHSRRLLTFGIFLLGMAVVLGGFVCNLVLSQHFLSDLLAGLTGGAGAALVSWSLAQGPPPGM